MFLEIKMKTERNLCQDLLIDSKRSFADVLFYMTDGYGRFPKKAPSLPVAWILSHAADIEVPFGQKIELN